MKLSGKNPAEGKANGKTLQNFPHNVKIFKKGNLRSLSRVAEDFLGKKSLPTEIFPKEMNVPLMFPLSTFFLLLLPKNTDPLFLISLPICLYMKHCNIVSTRQRITMKPVMYAVLPLIKYEDE